MKVEFKEKKDNLWELTIKNFYTESEIGVKMDKDLTNVEMETLFNKMMELSGANKKTVVGPMSEIFAKYVNKCENKETEVSIKGWKSYYLRNHREKYESGKEKFSSYVVAMKKKELESYGMILEEDNINKIAKKADEYFNNLIFVKTCQGLFIEKAFGDAIIKLGHTWAKNYDDESLGIDGYVNDIPVSVKPKSFKKTSDYIPVTVKNIATYTKSGKNLIFSLNFNLKK